MGQQVTIIVNLISIVLTLSLTVYILMEGKRSKLLYSFVFLQATDFIWSLGLIFEAISITKEQGFSTLKFYYIGICFIGYAWLLFCLYYSNLHIVLKNRIIILMAVPPSLLYLSLVTNELHYLFYTYTDDGRAFGILFWVHFVFSYAYILAGDIIMVRYAVKGTVMKRNQIIMVISAAIIPLIFNIFYLVFKFRIEITPFSFIISSILFIIATYKYNFLDVESKAMKNYVDTMQEGIFVFNKDLKIIRYNTSLKKFLPDFKISSDNMSSLDIAYYLKNNCIKTLESEIIVKHLESVTAEAYSGEIVLAQGNEQSLRVNINPVQNLRGITIGTTVSFHNIQKYKNLMKDLENKNESLTILNQQISEYALKVKELAIAKERNRISRDVHDTLGHTLVSLIALTEALDVAHDKDQEKTEKIIKDLMKISKNGLNDLRRSILGMTPDSLEANNLIIAVSKLVDNLSNSKCKIDLSYEGNSEQFEKEISDALFKICQEAITNSIKHGKALNIKILFIFNKLSVKLFIFDDGIGCADVKKGNGLAGMEDRVSKLCGKITFGSDGEKGFNVHIEIPLNTAAMELMTYNHKKSCTTSNLKKRSRQDDQSYDS